MTSRWVDEVARQRSLDVSWHVMSLAVLNEDSEPDDEHRAFFPRTLHGQFVVKPLYDALGVRIHPGKRKDVEAVIAEALAETGLRADLARYADSEEFDPQMCASHFDGIGRVGQDVRTPVIAVGDSAFFGPVIFPAPKGEQAAALWDAVVAIAGTTAFSN